MRDPELRCRQILETAAEVTFGARKVTRRCSGEIGVVQRVRFADSIIELREDLVRLRESRALIITRGFEAP